MVTINVSKPENYYSQRNNEFRSSSACNVTSAAAFIEISEKKMPFTPEGMSLDDFMMASLIGKEGYEKMFELAETLYPDYAPNEVHVCLSWAINRMVGKEVSKFISNNTLETFIFSLVKGKPVIVSGKFGDLNHIVLLVGVQTSQSDIMMITSPEDVKLDKVRKFYIDDPWGDPNTGYTSHAGDDVELSYRDFMDIIKPQTDTLKWGHLHTDIIKLLN